MSYFTGAREMSENLRVPLLMRVEADPRFLQRHDRISRFAADTAGAGRFYHRLQEIVEQIVPERDLIGRILWVTGPWGSLEHLPWAIGLADQVARLGWTALLSEREGGGTLRSLFPRSGSLPLVSLPDAEKVLGSPLVAAATDLEGVRLLFSSPGQQTVGERPPQSLRRWSLILADSLPESLEGPYPSGKGILGVILVASFRDHTAWSLHAAVDSLRAAGNQVLGLVAIGPEQVEQAETTTDRAGSTPVSLPEASSRLAAALPSPLHQEPSAVPEPPPPIEVPPARFEASSLLREHFPEAPPPVPARSEPAPPEPAPAPAATTPVQAEPPVVPPAPPAKELAEETRSVPLFSVWHTTRVRRARARHLVSVIALIALSGVLTLIVYLRFLKPFLTRQEPPGSVPPAEIVPSAPADTMGRPSELLGHIEPAPAGSALTEAPALGSPMVSAGNVAGSAAPHPVDPDSMARQAAAPESLRAKEASRPADVARRSPPDSLARPGQAVDSMTLGAIAGDTATSVSPAETTATLSEELPAVRGRSAPARPDSFVIHLSSFRLFTEAETEVGRFRALGIEARYLRVPISGQGTWYRVITGRFGTFAEAESVALRLLAAGKIPSAHVVPGGGWGAPVPIGGTEPDR